MNDKELELFGAIMDTGSVSAAALAIGRSQPQASRLLAALEARLGFPLFSRANQRLTPTPQAVAFHPLVAAHLLGSRELADAAQRLRASWHGHLRLLVPPHLASGLVADAVALLLRRRPEVTFSLDVRTRADFLATVRRHQFDLAVQLLPLQHEGLVSEHFASRPAVLLMPAEHRLAAMNEVSVADLVDEPLIAARPLTRVRTQLDRAFASLGRTPRIVVEAASSRITPVLVAEGVGLAVQEPFVARKNIDAGLVVRPLVPGIILDYALVYPVRDGGNPLAAEMADIIRELAG